MNNHILVQKVVHITVIVQLMWHSTFLQWSNEDGVVVTLCLVVGNYVTSDFVFLSPVDQDVQSRQ